MKGEDLENAPLERGTCLPVTPQIKTDVTADQTTGCSEVTNIPELLLQEAAERDCFDTAIAHDPQAIVLIIYS
jgi:hypothetical protein